MNACGNRNPLTAAGGGSRIGDQVRLQESGDYGEGADANKGGAFVMKRGPIPVFLLLVMTFLAGSASAATEVIVDQFNSGFIGYTASSSSNPTTGSQTTTAAIGGVRDVYVKWDDETDDGGVTLSVASNGGGNFTQGTDTGGYGFFEWDGASGVNVDGSGNPLTPNMSLGNKDFSTGCGTQAFKITVKGDTTDAFTMRMVVYSSAANWSYSDVTVPVYPGSGASQSLTFNFSGFTTGGGSGAIFTSVNAIRLFFNYQYISDYDNAPVNLSASIQSALTGCEQDFGDAPISYGTTQAGNGSGSGAFHVPSTSTLYLGTVPPDTESNAWAGNGTGDNTNGTDDEEGLVSITAASQTSVTAKVNVFNNTGSAAQVCGFLDVNVNGVWANTNTERKCATASSTGSSQEVTLGTWSFGNLSNSGTTYARFRVCSTAAECTTPYGLATNGEVEDYAIPYDFTPTRAVIGDVSIDALTADAAIATLLGDTDPNDASALLALLTALDPDAAAGLDGANAATLRAALTALLDADGDGLIALLKWETLSEDGTIGFYVERLAPGGDWTRLNADLLPGLIVSAGGGDYALIDPDALSGQTLQYRLIEQEATGDQRTYGPYEVRMTPAVSLAANAAGSSARAGRLSKAKATETATSATPWQGLSEGFIGRARAPAFTKTMEKNAAAEARAIDASPVSTVAAQTTASTQWLYTRGAGLYRLTAAELAGLTGKSLNQVRTALKLGSMVNLSNSGRPAPWIYDPASDALLFSALDYRDLYTDQDAFRLSVSGAASRTMPRVSGGGPKAGQPGGVVMDRIRLEQDVFYKPDIIRDDVNADYWFQDYLYPNLAARREISVPINLPGLVPGGGEADLAIRLHGQTDVLEGDDHDVSLWFDGSRIASAQWDGPAPATITAHLDSAQLAKVAAGTRLVLKGARMNTLQWLDYVDVTYPRALRADDGKLLLRDLPRGVYTVSGFDGRAIRVIQAPGTAAARWRDNVTIRQGTDGWQVSFSVWQNADVLLVADESIAAPSAIVADEPKVLRHRRNQADYLIIAPHSLAETAEALRAWRAQSFSKVEIAWLSDIEQEFGNGRPGARAVDAFLEYVAGNWRSAPETVTIVGRATLDHRNLMGYGNSMIPVPMVATPWGLVPSDFAYSQVGDRVRFALGRIPVVDDAEGLAYIAKIQAAEAATPGVAASTAVVVADNPDDAGDFHANGNELGIALGSKGYGVRNLYRCILGETDPACTNVRTALTTSATWEAALVNFSGHGALMQLGDGTEKFLQVGDVAGLRNATQPVFAGMTCLVGGNAYPQWRSLTETLVLREGGGAIAALAPSGQSIDGDAHRMNLTFVDALTAGASIGEAARDTVNENQGAVLPFMKEIYQVTGEPAMRLP